MDSVHLDYLFELPPVDGIHLGKDYNFVRKFFKKI